MSSMACCIHVNADTFSVARWNELNNSSASDNLTAARQTCQKENEVCQQVANLWLCLHPECGFIGCSEEPADHSTDHATVQRPDHLLQVNMSTRRIWCYGCSREIVLPSRDSTEGCFGSNLLPPEDGLFEARSPRGMRGTRGTPHKGLVGLSNLGNTCYMNAALQCLLNTPALTEFFTTCSALVEKSDSQKQTASASRAFLKLVDETWGRRVTKPFGYVAPSGVLYAIKMVHPMFRGYYQQDSQEFLRYFMDQLHEELLEPVIEADTEEEEEEEDRHLDSLSGESDPEEEYETADSGVSEQSVDLTEEQPNAKAQKYVSRAVSKRNRPSSADGHWSDDPEYTDAGSGSPTGNTLVCSSSSALPGSPSRSSLVSQKQQPAIRKRKPLTYRSIISDIFDGKLVSTVQCLTCNRVSLTTEAFQDLSLPIPTQESLASMRNQPLSDSWLTWAWSWVSGFFYGPNISLHDCLCYFFSADELKGDNMYSCERCKKLRNGEKFSLVTELPDTLCIHLKRFRHDFAFSSKVSTRVTFPLVDLDMSPWLHKDSKSKVSTYDLTGIICHHGHAGGGHYTAYGLNHLDGEWYEFDDSSVSKVDAATVMNSEPYVLFYRKHNIINEGIKEQISRILADNEEKPSLMTFYISKQWLNKLENFAEPGPIDNSDFLCPHGGVLPQKSSYVYDLAVALPQPAWNLLHSTFGGGPATNRLHECSHCRGELDALIKQKEFELQEFKTLHKEFQESDRQYSVIYCLSSSWFKLWEAFVTGRAREPPGPIDNRSIITTKNGIQTMRQASDYIQISQDIWLLFHSIYGGGPEVVYKNNGQIYVGATGVKPSLPAFKTRLRARTVSESLANQQSPAPLKLSGVVTRSRVRAEQLSKSFSDPEQPDH